MHRFISLIIAVAGCHGAYAAQPEAVSLESIIREAQVSNALSDRYKALRMSLFLKEKRLDAFVQAGVDQYLEALERLSSTTAFSNECDRLSRTKNVQVRDRILTTCGRLLVEDYSLQKAQKHLLLVSDKTDFTVPARILLATTYLSVGDGPRCLKALPTNLTKSIKNTNLKDFFFMSRSRCFLEVNDIPHAILEYQQISPASTFYYDALEEIAWAQFKKRHLESARTLLDVLITTYETGLGEGRAVTPSAYFRSRYLQAYIELIEKNSKRAEALFRSLGATLDEYFAKNPLDQARANSLAKLVISDNGKWLDLKAMPKEILKFLDMVKMFGDTRMRKRLDRLIDLEFSLNREAQRLKAEPSEEFADHFAKIKALQAENQKLLIDEFGRAARATERAIRVLRIKANLGRIEIIWAERAQGTRSIGELVEAYKLQQNEVEDFFVE